MSRTKKLVWAAVAVITLAVLLTATFPSHNVSYDRAVDSQKSRTLSEMRSEVTTALTASPVAGLVAGDAREQMHYANPNRQIVANDSKVIRNADLSLVVRDVRETATQIVNLIATSRGSVDRLELSETKDGCFSATLIVRVPSTGLNNAVAELKSLALRTEHEQLTARDVTREFYDNEAHLRNLHAEEQQYLAIMRQTGKIPDTLQVAERLSDVRDRIERQQAAMQVMNHDIDMSLISITLSKQVDTKVAGFEWRPMQNARAATRELLIGLSEWLDNVIALIIKLPLVLVWLLSIAAIGWMVVSVCRNIWRRIRHRFPQIERTSPAPSDPNPQSAKQ